MTTTTINNVSTQILGEKSILYARMELHTIETPANVKWGNTNSITSRNKTFVPGVKKDKGEHAIQHVHKIFPILFILKKISG